MNKDEKLFLLGGAIFLLSQDAGKIQKMFDTIRREIQPGSEAPLAIARQQEKEWQTYTTQAEKNGKVSQYFRECGYRSTEVYTWAWCQAFVSWCALKAGMPLLPTDKQQWISCSGCRDHYKSIGQLKDNADIAVGDFVFMDLNKTGSPNHVGFVSDIVSPGKHIQTLEGNYSGKAAYVERKNTIKDFMGAVTIG